MNKIICAVIVSYNSPEKLKSCISSSLNQVDKVVVVDNSTNHDLKKIIINFNYSDSVTFIFNENNKGLGAALNQGIKYSLKNGYKWTLLLDQDSIVSENMVREMLLSNENLEDKIKEKTALLVPRIYDRYFKDKKELPAIITTWLFNKKIESSANDCFVHFQITSGSMIRNEAVKKVGLMNEDFFIDYLDFDYCFRFLNSNFKILLCCKALLYHSLGETRDKLFFHFREHKPLRVYYQTRNRLFILYKYGRKYKSVLYGEMYRFISKLPKILFLESCKAEKIKMYFKGIVHFIRDYEKLNKEF